MQYFMKCTFTVSSKNLKDAELFFLCHCIPHTLFVHTEFIQICTTLKAEVHTFNSGDIQLSTL